MSLFRSRPSYPSTKLAAREVRLGPDPNGWPQQILQEAFKSVPALKDYTPEVQMDQTDPEAKAAYGALILRTQSVVGAPSPFAKMVRVPFIVRDGKLLAMDLLAVPKTPEREARILPLTEKRLRQALFRPDLFDVAAPQPADTNLGGMLYPPERAASSMMGLGGMMGKMGSVLSNALGLCSSEQASSLTRSVLAEKVAFQFSEHARPSLALMQTAREQVKQASKEYPTHVLQITDREDGTYGVKTASDHAWAPEVLVMDRAALWETYGEKIAEAVDEGKEITLRQGGIRSDDVHTPMQQIDKPGMYKVRSSSGEELVGMVFPSLMTLKAEMSPVALYFDGQRSSFQSSMLGLPEGEPPALPLGQRPTGYGTYVGKKDGRLTAMVPMKVLGHFSDQNEHGVAVESVDGSETTIQFDPDLKEPVVSGERLMLPMHWQWLSLERTKATPIATHEVVESGKTASLACYGTQFAVTGECVAKLAHEERSDLSISQGMFLLTALGCDPEYAAEKLAEAFNSSGHVSVRVSQDLVPRSHIEGEVKQAWVSAVAKGYGGLQSLDLVKEAAFIPDPTSVDTLLGLKLLTPETLLGFIAAIPQIEETQATLCQLLFAARLGLQDVPEEALEKCIPQIESTLEGLRSVQFQEP